MFTLRALKKTFNIKKDGKKDIEINKKQEFIALDATVPEDLKLKTRIEITGRNHETFVAFTPNKEYKEVDYKDYYHFSYYDQDIINELVKNKILVDNLDGDNEKKPISDIRKEFINKLDIILKKIIPSEYISKEILQKVHDSSFHYIEKPKIMQIAMIETMIRCIAFVGLYHIEEGSLNLSYFNQTALKSFINSCGTKIKYEDIDDLMKKPEFKTCRSLSIEDLDYKFHKMFFFYQSIDSFIGLFKNDEINSLKSNIKNALGEIIMRNNYSFDITKAIKSCELDIQKFAYQLQAVCQIKSKNTTFIAIE